MACDWNRRPDVRSEIKLIRARFDDIRRFMPGDTTIVITRERGERYDECERFLLARCEFFCLAERHELTRWVTELSLWFLEITLYDFLPARLTGIRHCRCNRPSIS